MDDASYFPVIRLGPKTSECEKNVIVMSTVTGCHVSNCATSLYGFDNASSRREGVSVSRGVPRYTECVLHHYTVSTSTFSVREVMSTPAPITNGKSRQQN